MKLKGLKQLKSQLRELERATKKHATSAAREAFKPVLAEARATAPEDTGLLKKRTKMKTVRPKDGKTLVAVGLVVSAKPEGDRRNWAWYERGVPARGIAAQPFIRPAFDRNIETMKSTLARKFREVLKLVAGKKGK